MFLKISLALRAGLEPASFFKKETPTQVLSCEVCEAFKNTYFEEHL